MASPQNRPVCQTGSTPSRRVVITGAGRGIGLEMSRALIEQGHAVYGAVRNPDAADALRDLNPAAILQLDISDARSIASFGDALADRTSAIDILVNNAGVNSRTFGIDRDQTGPWEADPDVVLDMTNINAIGPMLVTRVAIGLLEVGDGPVVLNTSSQLGSMEYARSGASDLAYNVSKAALNMITASFASTNQSVCFVALHPGWVRSEMGTDAAPLGVTESAEAIVESLLSLTQADSGRFIRWDGSDHPW